VKTIGVVGAGTMGVGIAIVAARSGFRTLLHDLRPDILVTAREQIRAFLATSVRRQKLDHSRMEAALDLLVTTADPVELRDADLVIEAVYEDIAVKRDVLSALGTTCSTRTIFASNTSTLSITDLANASGRPDRFVGMHFCLPAQLMTLVELTPALTTDPRVFAAAWDVCVAMGQRPVRTADRPGFILNHFVVPFNNDAVRLVERGVAIPEDIDRAVRSALGYPMGPCELLDLIGLDTQVRLSEALYAITVDPRTACPPLLRQMVAAGRLGRKAGRGFYTYKNDTIFGA
jgi:3-hydroxybutyryl-CoA dehydrogenase